MCDSGELFLITQPLLAHTNNNTLFAGLASTASRQQRQTPHIQVMQRSTMALNLVAMACTQLCCQVAVHREGKVALGNAGTCTCILSESSS